MGRDRRVAIDVITSTFRVIITTDTPERGRWEISLNFSKSQFWHPTSDLCKLDHFVVSIKSFLNYISSQCIISFIRILREEDRENFGKYVMFHFVLNIHRASSDLKTF